VIIFLEIIGDGETCGFIITLWMVTRGAFGRQKLLLNLGLPGLWLLNDVYIGAMKVA